MFIEKIDKMGEYNALSVFANMRKAVVSHTPDDIDILSHNKTVFCVYFIVYLKSRNFIFSNMTYSCQVISSIIK